MTRLELVRRGSVVFAVVLVTSVLAVTSILRLSPDRRSPEKRQHVRDETGLIPPRDMPGFEALLGAITRDYVGLDDDFYRRSLLREPHQPQRALHQVGHDDEEPRSRSGLTTRSKQASSVISYPAPHPFPGGRP